MVVRLLVGNEAEAGKLLSCHNEADRDMQWFTGWFTHVSI